MSFSNLFIANAYAEGAAPAASAGIMDFIPLIGYGHDDCKPWGVKELMDHYEPLKKE